MQGCIDGLRLIVAARLWFCCAQSQYFPALQVFNKTTTNRRKNLIHIWRAGPELPSGYPPFGSTF